VLTGEARIRPEEEIFIPNGGGLRRSPDRRNHAGGGTAGAERQGPVQRLADRVSAVFVPVVIVIVLGVLAAWLATGHGPAAAFSIDGTSLPLQQQQWSIDAACTRPGGSFQREQRPAGVRPVTAAAGDARTCPGNPAGYLSAGAK
jgi:hypothetical protein